MSSDNIHEFIVSSFDSLLPGERRAFVEVNLGVLRTSEDLERSVTLEGYRETMGSVFVKILVYFLKFSVDGFTDPNSRQFSFLWFLGLH